MSSWSPGPGNRPDAACPHCNSLERHRVAALVLDWLAPLLLGDGLVVEAAPTPTVRRMLIDRVGRRRYLGFDLGLDARMVDVYADLTQMPFADASLSVLVCFHVLEHVPSDEAAMQEIARVVADDGVVLVMNPWRRGSMTEEDPDASEEERVRRFGQADHVRLYGEDFEDRLRSAGLDVLRFEPALDVPLELTVMANLGDEPLWLLTRSGERGAPIRKRLQDLLPPRAGAPTSVRMAGVAPVVVVPPGDDVEAAAALLRDVPGLRLGRDIGALEQAHRLTAVLRDGRGARRRFAEEQLVALDGAARRYLAVGPGCRWGEVLPGLTSAAGRELVESLLDRLPEAQVVHLVEASASPPEARRRLRATCLGRGPGRYLEVSPGDPDLGRVVSDFLWPGGLGTDA